MKILQNDSDTHEKMMAYMESFNDNEFSPYVGTFWYHTKLNQLFGINKIESTVIPFNTNGLKTTPRLHKQIWAKAKQQGDTTSLFRQSDYTVVPRGRVFQKSDGTFEVMVGSWIETYPKVKKLVINEFDLPEDDTVFTTDTHWDIGNGWEGDK